MRANTKISTSIRQDTLYLLKDVLKEAIPDIEQIDTSQDITEILQEFTLGLVKSCNNRLDNIEGRGYK